MTTTDKENDELRKLTGFYFTSKPETLNPDVQTDQLSHIIVNLTVSKGLTLV